MQNKALKNLTAAALIAALYTALTLIVAPLSFGPVQIRLSEALTVLPAVCPPAVWGLSLGCFLSNLLYGQSLKGQGTFVPRTLAAHNI